MPKLDPQAEAGMPSIRVSSPVHPIVYEQEMLCVAAEEFETAVQIEEEVGQEKKLHACMRSVWFYSFVHKDVYGRTIPGGELTLRLLAPGSFEVGRLYKIELK